jgi:hypothetical protein
MKNINAAKMADYMSPHLNTYVQETTRERECFNSLEIAPKEFNATRLLQEVPP